MTQDPEHFIGEMAAIGLVCVFLWRGVVRLRQTPISPDPWDKEIENAVHDVDAVEVCHRCFDPVNPGARFCAKCGSAVGPYNNLMPYINVFSEGEVLRNGVNDRFRPNALIVAGYLLYSISAYFVFAPVYWVFLFKNVKRHKQPNEAAAIHSG